MSELRSHEPSLAPGLDDFMDSAERLDLTTCDREPIHLSGAIQPHGVLLAVRESDLVVVHASVNAQALLGLTVGVVGASLERVLGAEPVARLVRVLDEGHPSGIDPLPVQVPAGAAFEVTWHRRGGWLLVELEPVLAPQRVELSTPFEEVRRAMDALSATDTVLDLCRVAAAEVKRLAGYDRVMVYRFHPDDHGEVIAEECAPHLEPFLGLHYPASDIPVQARKLYLLNRLRMIVDVDYEPVAIAPPVSGEPLDLSLAGLRSVSPIHLAYLRNMGVQATLAISLMHGNRLWGMLVCHHDAPMQIGAELRSSCALLGQLFSLLLVAKEGHERLVHRTRLAAVEARLVKAMSGPGPLAVTLTRADPSPLALVDADGVVARIEGQTSTVGRTPPPAAVEALLDRLQHEGDGAPFVSDGLSAAFAELEPFVEDASGVIAVALSPGYADFILWFRGEASRSVAWAGNPDKPMISDPADSAGGRESLSLSPRESFAAWVREVRGRSREWFDAEVDAAAALGKAVPELQLARARGHLADLSRRALHDSLTGLPNRAFMFGRIDASLARPDLHERNLSLLFVDLDRFKEVNDSLGHATGDALLVEVARRLKGVTRADDTVARLGGDEFVVLCHDSSADQATHLADRVLACFSTPFTIDGREIKVTASVGVAAAGPGTTAASLLDDSDTALYRAKETGRNASAHFTAEMRAVSLRPTDLESRLRSAIELGELTLHYQPILTSAGQLAGFEALARWPQPSPERGMVPPADFIPVAEDTGLIGPLTAWALGEALADLARWRLARPELALTMSVNVSAQQMEDGALGAAVSAALTGCDVPADALCLELTERVLVADDATSRRFVAVLRELGVRLAIDDFGTGFSSLAYLTHLPVHQVKIDRSFIAGLRNGHGNTAVVASIVGLAHQLGLEVVAEGVETQEQLTTVRRLGCDLTQGHLFGRAMPAEAAYALCRAVGPGGNLILDASSA